MLIRDKFPSLIDFNTYFSKVSSFCLFEEELRFDFKRSMNYFRNYDDVIMINLPDSSSLIQKQLPNEPFPHSQDSSFQSLLCSKSDESDSTLWSFRPHRGYIKVFDGSGAQIFTREGCHENHSSNAFLEIAFQESQNVTIQVSLQNNQSYARVGYGILEDHLESGEEFSFLFQRSLSVSICISIA